jgi:CubicO group peptidase (beta-lactamase class C family)
MLLGKIISVASGMDYQEYVKEAVLKPCGIADMQLGKSYAEERLPNEVLYYQPEDAKPTEAFDGSNRYATKVYGGNDITLLGSAGGWLASSIDLMKLVVRIDNKKNVPDILASKSIIEMTKVNPDGLDPLGWRSTNENGEWWRTGTLNGTSALIKRQPDGFSWVILSNTSNYKGPRLAIEMDRVMTTVLHKVKEWPDLDLFAYYNN